MSVDGDRWRTVLLVAGPPAAWMAHLLVSYAWVPAACKGSGISLHVTTAAFTALAAASMVLGLRGPGSRRPVAAVVLGGIFLLAIVLQGAASAMVDPCA